MTTRRLSGTASNHSNSEDKYEAVWLDL